jgi:hypothetical protein
MKDIKLKQTKNDIDFILKLICIYIIFMFFIFFVVCLTSLIIIFLNK